MARTIRIITNDGSGNTSDITRPMTAAEIADADAAHARMLEAKKLRDQRKAHALQNMEKLECEYCGAAIGWVYECDLSGSWFACEECKEKS